MRFWRMRSQYSKDLITEVQEGQMKILGMVPELWLRFLMNTLAENARSWVLTFLKKASMQ